MSKKQIWGLVIAAAVFITTGLISVFSHAITSKMNEASETMVSGTSYTMPISKDFMAVINVSGTIQESPEVTDYFGNSLSYDHDAIMAYVDELMDADNNKGIILMMDTPGGTVYESDEMYLKLEEYKEETGRPIYVYMTHYCCSGGYYIASAGDELYANRNAWTGSIGVIISTYNYKELFDKIGVKEINITSGDNKAMGHSGEEMTAEQRAIYQSLVDEAYDQFVTVASEGRNMSVSDMKKLADGRVYTAAQAKDNGLIDDVMGEEDFYDYVKSQVGENVEIYNPSSSGNTFSSLFGSLDKLNEQPKSDLEAVTDLINSTGNGVPMYVYTGQ